MTNPASQIPASAVAQTDDLVAPTTALLASLNLLPSKEDLADAKGFTSAFKGPPESVALIEAGATAANKWWAAGLGVAVLAAWGAVRTWWGGTTPSTQHVALWVAAIVTAAALIGIAYLLGSDVRGRAAVATETVRARAMVAEEFIRAVVSAHASAPIVDAAATDEPRPVPLPSLPVKNISKSGADENGWNAIALIADGKNSIRYLVVKGPQHEWVPSAHIEHT